METSCKVMTFSIFVEDQNGNNIRCPSESSPDDVRSSSGWSYGTSGSPAEVEMKDLDIGDGSQTLTPVLPVGKKTFCPLALSESPLQQDKGDSVSPVSQIINGKKSDSSQKLKSLMSDGKSNKADMKKFPKSNYSNKPSKMMSGASKPFKKSGAQVPKTSLSTVPQTNKHQSKDHVAQLNTSAKSTFCTPADVKTSSAPKRTRLSTYQESGPTSKCTSTKISKDGSQEKKVQVSKFSTTLTRPQTEGGSLNQGGRTKPADGYRSTKEDTQRSESLKTRGKNLKMSPQPSPARTGGVSAARPPTAELQPSPSAASKLKFGTTAKNDCRTSDTPSPRVQLCTSEGGAELRAKSSSAPQTNGHPKQGARWRNMSSLSQSSVRSSCSLLKTPTVRPVRPAATTTATGISDRRFLDFRLQFADCRFKLADKNKSRKTLRNLQPDLVPLESKSRSVEYCKKNKVIQGLEDMVRSNNRRFEAVAMVIKHLCAEQEEEMKQRRKLSQELIAMRGDLVSSSLSCERLEEEKEELRAAFDGVLQKVQEQHRSDLSDLEERLKTFYSTEWEKVHQTYQEEAEKCKALMKQQLEELRLKHQALKKELEENHIVEVDNLKHHFEEYFKELKQSHEQEMETLLTTLKNSEETSSNQIRELLSENNDLKEKLNAEEKRRKDLAERTQDSHTLYLEQELESLKVVLDIKNNQIHEQDKKLMQIDKLMERNVKLDECLKKLQQENEDLRARMDKHAALSKQLSTEQMLLQESLQKESSVNKRLSMENEELLWKLHNGDLSSPRKVSPSPSLTLQPPQNSGLFTSPPISPR